MPRCHDLQTIEPAALAHVTGGGSSSSSSSAMALALVVAMMGRRRAAPKIAPEVALPAAPAPAPEPPVKVEINGQAQELARGADGVLSYDDTKQAAAAPAPTQPA